MRTIDELFTVFGGPSKVGQAIGVSTEHAAAMKRRHSIPSRYWLSLVKAAEGRDIGLSLENLARLNEQERPAPEQERQVS